jgi:hypothetical protein
VDLLRIEWPIGVVEELKNVAASQVLTVTEHQAGATNAPSLAVSKSADGALQLRATGQTNLRYAFEASTNLVQWTKIAVCTNLTGTILFERRQFAVQECGLGGIRCRALQERGSLNVAARAPIAAAVVSGSTACRRAWEGRAGSARSSGPHPKRSR